MRHNADPENEWMARLAVKSRTEGLVKDILGCACPQEVFDHYKARRRMDGSPSLVRLIMGERLLVELVDASRIRDPKKTIPDLLRGGVETRDDLGLHRFRLVIAGLTPAIERTGFEECAHSMGPNVHIHFIDAF